VNYGVREFAMGAALNGLALHGGFVPYGGTFLVFSDYMRNAIRLAALMKSKTLFVMTHDSIGLGEDGPTHQPVEHLASLRAIPGLNVFRPADVVETMESYQAALAADGPSLLVFSRQAISQVRLTDAAQNLSAKGAYLLEDPLEPRDITLIATGTEVALALAVSKVLTRNSYAVAVVSMPCWLLFDRQDKAYQQAVLGDAPRLAIEAASPFGWAKYVQSEDNMIGVSQFGASASAEQLYEQLGLTEASIVARAEELMKTIKTAA